MPHQLHLTIFDIEDVDRFLTDLEWFLGAGYETANGALWVNYNPETGEPEKVIKIYNNVADKED